MVTMKEVKREKKRKEINLNVFKGVTLTEKG